jgi:SAM-dependent methyltransferase
MRNTDEDWQRIANSTPYYGVLAHERFLNPTADDLDDFFRSGQADIDHVLKVIREKFGGFHPKSALDFGCGVGRTLIPLARHTGKSVGIDVADRMLELATRHIAQSGVNATVSKSIPNDMTFDWVHSWIVFQHIPPRRGYSLLRHIWSHLNLFGFMSLHLTIYKDSKHTGDLIRDAGTYSYDGDRALIYSTPKENEGEGGSMSMFDYDLSRVISILSLTEGQPLYMEHVDHGGCHGVRIYVQKL